MNGLDTAGTYLLQTLGSLYLMIVLLRFVLQLVRADFYNPISQFVVRATRPLLNPLRRVVPGFGGLDLSSLVLALLVQLAVMALILLLAGVGLPLALWPQLLVWALIGVAAMFVNLFFYALIASVILSWVAPHSSNPGAQLVQQLCEPLLMPIRRLLPSLGGLDLSPIFAFIALNLMEMLVIRNLAVMTQMPRALSPFL